MVKKFGRRRKTFRRIGRRFKRTYRRFSKRRIMKRCMKNMSDYKVINVKLCCSLILPPASFTGAPWYGKYWDSATNVNTVAAARYVFGISA
jgi:hypothetical protein